MIMGLVLLLLIAGFVHSSLGMMAMPMQGQADSSTTPCFLLTCTSYCSSSCIDHAGILFLATQPSSAFALPSLNHTQPILTASLDRPPKVTS